MFDVKISFKSKKAIGDIKQGLDRAVRLVATDVLRIIKRITPVRSGRARRSWKLNKKSNKNYEVRSNVPYGQRLDAGYSKKAPRGMTRPTLREVLSANRSRRIR